MSDGWTPVVPVLEWGAVRAMSERRGRTTWWKVCASCGCNVEVRDGYKPAARICDDHSFASTDTGLAKIRAVLGASS